MNVLGNQRLTALAAALLVLGGVLTGCGTGASSAQQDASPSSQASQSASQSSSSTESSSSSQASLLGEFAAQDLQGNDVDQSILEGHPVTMVNIWATFCGPCLSEMPDLGALHTEYADKGFQVVGIVIDVLQRDGSLDNDQVALAAEIVEKTGANYLHLLPSNDLINAKLAQVTAVPETFFVDESGNLLGDSYLGARSKEEWQKIIDELLTQAGGES